MMMNLRQATTTEEKLWAEYAEALNAFATQPTERNYKLAQAAYTAFALHFTGTQGRPH